MFSYITACGPEPALSAKDYDTRLSNLKSDLDVREIIEISTQVINAHKKDFDDIQGWYADKDLIGREVVRKQTRVNGRGIEITLELKKDRVSGVKYSYDDSDIDDFFGYIKFDTYGENMQVSWSELGGDGKGDFADNDELLDKFAVMLAEDESVLYIWRWDYTNKNEDDCRVSYSFGFNYSDIIGAVMSTSMTFSLKP